MAMLPRIVIGAILPISAFAFGQVPGEKITIFAINPIAYVGASPIYATQRPAARKRIGKIRCIPIQSLDLPDDRRIKQTVSRKPSVLPPFFRFLPKVNERIFVKPFKHPINTAFRAGDDDQS